MRPEQWEPLPRRQDRPPTWWERNGGGVAVVGVMLFLALLDILGL